MKISVKIFLLFLSAAYLVPSADAWINFGGMKTKIANTVPSLLPSCISGSGNIKLFFYSQYFEARNVNLENRDELPINNSAKTVFWIHGFNSKGTGSSVNQTVSTLLKQEFSNVFVVDWSIGACGDTNYKVLNLNLITYKAAVANTKKVGKYLAKQIEVLVDYYSVSLNDVWLIGHSLGAHVSGFTGKYVYKNLGEKVGRITGLDPAGPLFTGLDATERLDKTDAKTVDIAHTSGLLGLQEAIGDVDFYFNGGNYQNSCLLKSPGCSHNRVIDYYLETIRNDDCKFFARAWSRTGGFKDSSTNCTDSCTTIYAFAETYSVQGSFYVGTNSKAPFCTGELPNTDRIDEDPVKYDLSDDKIYGEAI